MDGERAVNVNVMKKMLGEGRKERKQSDGERGKEKGGTRKRREKRD